MIVTLLSVKNPENFKSYAPLLPLVSDERRRKVLLLRSDREKTISLAAAVLTKTCISKDLDIPFSDVRITCTETGKPVIPGEDYWFSLSHSGSRIAFVSDRLPVGIDVEHIRPRIRCADLAGRFFTEQEARSVTGSDDPADTFCRIWTMKEAYVKMTGEGIAKGLNTFDVLSPGLKDRIWSYRLQDGYVSVSCSAAIAPGAVQLRSLTEAALPLSLTAVPD